MSGPVVRISGDGGEETQQTDVAMAMGEEEGTEDNEGGDEALEVAEAGEGDGDGEDERAKPSFVELLASPIIEVAIGAGAGAATLTAHAALLQRSPFFAAAMGQFSGDAATSRRVELREENVEAMGAFLQYLYTDEYTPRKVGDGGLEGVEAAGGGTLDDGAQLLRHARVYTLADKLGMAGLKALAHSKVHRINSSAAGEIAYARYVYAHTAADDTAIRKPIASFWGQRSHVLRHEAERAFRDLCIEFPEFGFDVLSYVLDARERKARDRDSVAAPDLDTPKSGRKRARPL